MWMIWECVRYDPDSRTWLWLLIFLNFPGAVIYFCARKLPNLHFSVTLPRFLQLRLRQKEIWRAEADVLNIGNAHQYIILGDLKRDLGLYEEAKDAYQQALDKEPQNLKALWGLVLVEQEANNLECVKQYLQQILKIKPDYEYGDGELLYIKTLLELGEKETVEPLLLKCIKVWNKPEARLILAETYIEQNKIEEAKEILKKLIFSIRSSAKFHYKRNQHFEKKAMKILKNL
ncbi:MAG: tetratricopeptide repeat protein [Cyanobacteria bacterium J06621_8]